MEGSRHFFEEHVGEVKIRLEAPSLAELFAEAGRALAGMQLDGSGQGGARKDEEVTVQATDREALLAEWLNELIFRSETRRCVFTTFEIARISDRELQGRIGGTAIERPRLAVKAATLHGLRVEETAGRWSATVVLDV